MTAPAYDVAIVGAGFTGTALAIQLLRRSRAGSRILLVGTPKATGRGVAYGTEVEDHLLNVRAGRMSLLPGEPGHFVRWLDGATEHETLRPNADSYVPRRLYGEYVRQTLYLAISEANPRIRFDIIEGTATEIGKRDSGYSVRLASGQAFRVRTVALAIGSGQPRFPLPEETIDPEAGDRLIADPWSDYRVGTIAKDARVLCVGTGLTMVDQVLGLAARGHRGPITAVSRHGLVPAPHLPSRTEPRLIDLPEAPPLREAFRRVVAAARETVAAGADWRAVIDGLRPVSQRLWQDFDAADRRAFVRHVEAIWSVHRHRMAPDVAERIATLRKRGALTIRAAKVLAIRRSGPGLTVALGMRGRRRADLVGYDWAVNCCATQKASQVVAEPLVAQAIAGGLTRPDPLGFGLDIDGRCGVVGRNGQPTPGLFALGSLTTGRFYEITAVPDIREQCAAVAGEIATSLASGRDWREDRAPAVSGSVH